jgi:Na+-transporting NADH:ubiquinone oxidoreductase subunit C
MKAEKVRFSETRFYPIFFMIIITLFFVGILAVFYHSTEDKIREYEEINYKKAVLKVFGLLDRDVSSFKKYVDEKEEPFRYFIAKENDTIIGYSFDISGSGLWGTIDAVIAVDVNFEKIIGLEILKQNETPGLGGRITEDWFKNQFYEKPLKMDDEIKKFRLIAEDQTAEKNDIKQITGATFSSKAVVDIIYNEVLKKAKMMDK